VKFLFDANLPPRLRDWLKSHRHEAEHLFDLNLLTATDTQIWQHGKGGNLVIFTKDVDFYERAGNWGQRIFLISSEPANPTCGRLQRDITLEFQMQYETPIYPSE
jgi:predicted nuclease of predicted toxin-antitoxin system